MQKRCTFFQVSLKIVSAIGTVESANVYFLAGFADSRASIVLKKIKLEKIDKV